MPVVTSDETKMATSVRESKHFLNIRRFDREHLVFI